jgi:hypothetical protein
VSVKVGEPGVARGRREGSGQHPARRGSAEAAAGRTDADHFRGGVVSPPSSIVAQSGPGLRFSWIVYRGNAAAVTFTPIR